MNQSKEPCPRNSDNILSRWTFVNKSAGTAAAGFSPRDIGVSLASLAPGARFEESDGVRFAERRGLCTGNVGLSRALANQAMQSARLSDESRNAAVVAERNRMARDIHDTLAQGFTGVMLQLEAAKDALSQNLPGKAAEHLGRAREIAREGLRETRRSVGALRSPSMERRNLCEAMNELLKKMTDGTALRTQFVSSGRKLEIPAECEENLLHIGREALTNTIRHARATEFEARLAFDPDGVRLDLRDNGCGFDPAESNGFGLLGMRERVETIGARLLIRSARGIGTSIFVVLPFTNARESNLQT